MQILKWSRSVTITVIIVNRTEQLYCTSITVYNLHKNYLKIN